MKSLGYLGVFLFVAMQFSGCAGSRISGPGSRQWQQVIEFSQQKVWRSLESFGDSTLYPRSTGQDGRWKTVQPRDWTSGFFPGCLWYMSVLSKSCGGNDSLLKEAAMRWTEGLSSQQNLTQTHDIGFIIFDSFGKGYQLAGKTEYKPVILQAAR